MLNNFLNPHQKVHASWLIAVAIWLLTEPLTNALMGWIDEELGISSLFMQHALIFAWHYGIPAALIAFGAWFLIQPRLSGWPKSGAAKDESNASPVIDTTPFPDWTIRELFYYLRPDVVDDKDMELWKLVGSEVQDQLSIGRLQIWGREIQKPSRARAPLREIEKSYWSHAKFSYWFLAENHEDVNHTYPPQGTSLAEYSDLRINKAQALKIWPGQLGDKFAALPDESANGNKATIGYSLIKRGAEPELHMLLRPEERGEVTNTLDAGWPDHYVTETFLEFQLTDELRTAMHVELCFNVSRTSSSTHAGNVGHYAGTGTADINHFGAGLFLTRIELTKDSFEIDITQLVKQYTMDGASFIGVRFYNPEAANGQTKQFYVSGGHLKSSQSKSKFVKKDENANPNIYLSKVQEISISTLETHKCSHCGFGYQLNNFLGSNAALIGATTTCPKCGNVEKVKNNIFGL